MLPQHGRKEFLDECGGIVLQLPPVTVDVQHGITGSVVQSLHFPQCLVALDAGVNTNMRVRW
jgi:hypothetical protein